MGQGKRSPHIYILTNLAASSSPSLSSKTPSLDTLSSTLPPPPPPLGAEASLEFCIEKVASALGDVMVGLMSGSSGEFSSSFFIKPLTFCRTLKTASKLENGWFHSWYKGKVDVKYLGSSFRMVSVAT